MSFTTPQGTVLPIRDIKGKQYLDVAYRIIWFREEHPDWTIKTQIIKHDKTHTLAFCEIFDDQGRLRSSGSSMETLEGFEAHTEKAETSAVGRALGFLGYGTQFTLDLEDDKLADAPHKGTPKKNLEAKVAATVQKTMPAAGRQDSPKLSFQQANDLRTEGLKINLTMDQMTEIIKRVTGFSKFADVHVDQIALVKAEFLKSGKSL